MTRVVEAIHDARRRRMDRCTGLLCAALLVGLAAVVGRVAQLQTAPEASLKPHVQDRVSRKAEPGARGDLMDRRGRLLAGTRRGWRLFVDPAVFARHADVGPPLHAIAEVTGLGVADVAERVLERVVRNERRDETGRPLIRYVSVGGVLNDTQLARAQRLEIAGVHLEPRSVRETPAGDAVASLVGLVGVDGDGLAGAERAFNDRLLPTDGGLDYVRDARGRPLWVEARRYTPARRGDAVRLSLDLVVQEIAIAEIRRGLDEADARAGRAVVIDPRTGEVLALVDERRDVAGLTPYSPDRAREAEQAGERLRFDLLPPPDPRRGAHASLSRHRAVEDVYEPGSTFKPFVWACIVERGRIGPDDTVETNDGAWRTDFGREITDVTRRPRMTWADVLVHSSNVGMVRGALMLTHAELRSDVLRFGFGERTRLGLPGEAAGIVTSARDWTKYSQTSIPFGYEVAVTPLQMARAFGVFARTGRLAGTLPSLTLSAARPGDGAAFALERCLDPRVAAVTRETLQRVADSVVNKCAVWFPDDPPISYTLFGKTGTTEALPPGGRAYLERQYVSSFVAGAPVSDPSIVVLVVIDDPGPERVAQRRHFGAATAGPVVLRIVERTLSYLGVAPDRRPALASAEAPR